MEKTVGINQRISIPIIETAMKAALDGIFTPEYAADLAAGGENGAFPPTRNGCIHSLSMRERG